MRLNARAMLRRVEAGRVLVLKARCQVTSDAKLSVSESAHLDDDSWNLSTCLLNDDIR